MRILRFLLFLVALFLICFWLGGGSNLFTQPTGTIPTAMQDALKDKLQEAPALEGVSDTIASAWNSSARVIFLSDAVEKRMSEHAENYVPLGRVGQTLQQAVIAVEDNRFYTHTGFDVQAILRATLVNLQFGHIEEGASTITQQLAKNLFLSQDRALSRKAEEFILAIDLEMHYSKEKILELYLNTIYFGSGFYGIHDASFGYFGKAPDELTLAEAAMLAGLPNAPSLYSPYVDLQAAKYRQAIVLETMIKYGYINPTTAENAKNEEIRLMR